MIKRVIMTLGFDQMHGPRAVWSSLPRGYEYNIPNHGDVRNMETGEVVAHIGFVLINYFWVVADKSDSPAVRDFVTAYEQKNKVLFEEVPTSVLYLDVALVPDSYLEKLKRSVPPDYKVKQIVVADGEPETFLVTTIANQNEEMVAKVRVIGGRFVFEYEVNAFSANYFENWMKVSRPVTTE